MLTQLTNQSTPSPRLGIVVQRHTHGAAMMPVILPDDGLRVQLPQPRVVVAARRDQVRAVGAEGAVPDPALMALEACLERETDWGWGLRLLL